MAIAKYATIESKSWMTVARGPEPVVVEPVYVGSRFPEPHTSQVIQQALVVGECQRSVSDRHNER